MKKLTNIWKDILCPRIRKINTVKCSYYPKQSSFNVIPIKIPVAFFTEIENPEIHMEPQKTRNNQAILRKNSKAGASSS